MLFQVHFVMNLAMLMAVALCNVFRDLQNHKSLKQIIKNKRTWSALTLKPWGVNTTQTWQNVGLTRTQWNENTTQTQHNVW